MRLQLLLMGCSLLLMLVVLAHGSFAPDLMRLFSEPYCKDCIESSIKNEVPRVKDGNLAICHASIDPDAVQSLIMLLLIRVEDALRSNNCYVHSNPVLIHQRPLKSTNELAEEIKRLPIASLRSHPILREWLDTILQKGTELVSMASTQCRLDYRLVMKVVRMGTKMLANKAECERTKYERDRQATQQYIDGWRKKAQAQQARCQACRQKIAMRQSWTKRPSLHPSNIIHPFAKEKPPSKIDSIGYGSPNPNATTPPPTNAIHPWKRNASPDVLSALPVFNRKGDIIGWRAVTPQEMIAVKQRQAERILACKRRREMVKLRRLQMMQRRQAALQAASSLSANSPYSTTKNPKNSINPWGNQSSPGGYINNTTTNSPQDTINPWSPVAKPTYNGDPMQNPSNEIHPWMKSNTFQTKALDPLVQSQYAVNTLQKNPSNGLNPWSKNPISPYSSSPTDWQRKKRKWRIHRILRRRCLSGTMSPLLYRTCRFMRRKGAIQGYSNSLVGKSASQPTPVKSKEPTRNPLLSPTSNINPWENQSLKSPIPQSVPYMIPSNSTSQSINGIAPQPQPQPIPNINSRNINPSNSIDPWSRSKIPNGNPISNINPYTRQTNAGSSSQVLNPYSRSQMPNTNTVRNDHHRHGCNCRRCRKLRKKLSQNDWNTLRGLLVKLGLASEEALKDDVGTNNLSVRVTDRKCRRRRMKILEKLRQQEAKLEASRRAAIDQMSSPKIDPWARQNPPLSIKPYPPIIPQTTPYQAGKAINNINPWGPSSRSNDPYQVGKAVNNINPWGPSTRSTDPQMDPYQRHSSSNLDKIRILADGPIEVSFGKRMSNGRRRMHVRKLKNPKNCLKRKRNMRKFNDSRHRNPNTLMNPQISLNQSPLTNPNVSFSPFDLQNSAPTPPSNMVTLNPPNISNPSPIISPYQKSPSMSPTSVSVPTAVGQPIINPYAPSKDPIQQLKSPTPATCRSSAQDDAFGGESGISGGGSCKHDTVLDEGI